ncbi:hypothetical protein CY34DRAFT_808582 [Suillus luteus UH-Slu-Lm8-n1]|uniref:Unplaced genomic scaffold CY34scaffold_225, whole genome shotgun sequence n=1 Tax=Suillus luteus UH-Slu-Lm8-n1 TaxID=930992 RepID=A0A0C9ZNE0_9AGAM|nr:hypothetical protein CY34DRAFT_808582 [Suillus luteus UH-Slu-Lm8-n1]
MHWSLLISLRIQGNTKQDDDFLDTNSRRLGELLGTARVQSNHRPDCREKQTQPIYRAVMEGNKTMLLC